MDSGKNCSVPSGLSIETLFQKNQDKWINSNTSSFPPIHCVLMPQNSLSSLYPLLFHPLGLLLLHLYFFPSIELYVAQSPLSGRLFLIKHEVPCGPSNLLSLQVVIRAPYAVKLLNLTLIPLISLWFPWQQAFFHSLSYIPIVSYIMSTHWKKSLDCSEHTSHRSKDNTYELEQMTHMRRTLGRKAGVRAKAERWTQKKPPEWHIQQPIWHEGNYCTTTKSNRSWIMVASARLPKLLTVEVGIAPWFTNICGKLYKRCLVLSFS